MTVGQVQILKFEVDYTSALSAVWPKRRGRELAMIKEAFGPMSRSQGAGFLPRGEKEES